MNVFGLFPIPLGVEVLDYNESIDFTKIEWLELDRKEIDQNFIGKSKVSKNYKILKKYSSLNKKIHTAISDYIHNTLCLKRDFQIVSSWMTKTETGCESYFHSHTNCWLSACFYFDHGSPIKFRRQRESFTDSAVTSYNAFNSQTWDVSPQKNLLLIFPSHVEHKIERNESDVPRYSLAINILPKGNFGKGDSEFYWPSF